MQTYAAENAPNPMLLNGFANAPDHTAWLVNALQNPALQAGQLMMQNGQSLMPGDSDQRLLPNNAMNSFPPYGWYGGPPGPHT